MIRRLMRNGTSWCFTPPKDLLEACGIDPVRAEVKITTDGKKITCVIYAGEEKEKSGGNV